MISSSVHDAARRVNLVNGHLLGLNGYVSVGLAWTVTDSLLLSQRDRRPRLLRKPWPPTQKSPADPADGCGPADRQHGWNGL